VAYLVLADALARAKERSGATSIDDGYLTELLTLSAGVDGASQTHYRPFYCAAKWLEQNRPAQTLKKAKDGVEFTGLATPIASLFALQLAYDASQQLTVPPGFEVVAETTGTASTTNTQRFGTRSLSNRSRP
jgi:hypothetical protein